MKVAYFSPLPPDRSGIADYSALLLPALEQRIDVEVVRQGRTRPVSDADVALYHIGNDPGAHAWIVDALRRRPGVVVLHDFVIHHLVAGMTIGRKDGHAYLAAMEREAGVAGRLLGWGVLEGRVPPLWEVRPQEFPLVGEVLDRAVGVIVHSHYVERGVREHGYTRPVWRIPHPAWRVDGVAPAHVRGRPLFGCFGYLNETKRIPQLLSGFARQREADGNARLLLVGAESPGFDLAGRLERLGIDSDGVEREPFVEESRLWSLMAACDACVLLRAPTMGETSGSAIRALSLGKPLVVSDIGWFAELPDEVAIKVPVGSDEEIEALAGALSQLADPQVLARMGAAARDFAAEEHDLGRAADSYAAALEAAAGGAAVERGVLDEIAGAAAVSQVEPELLAPALVDLGLGSGDGGGEPASTPSVEAAGRFLGLWPRWLWVASLYAVAVVVQLSLALRVRTPWVLVDELIYSDTARSFANSAHFFVRGAPESFGFLYPLAISPAYAAVAAVGDVYQWARVINALLMCSAVFPAYLVARKLVRPSLSLAAAALAVAVPALAYTGTLLSENIAYPIFLWVVLALVRDLERPTLVRHVVLVGLCALAFMVRAQSIAFAGAALTAPIALAWIERGRRRALSSYAPLYAVTVLAGIGVVAVQFARGRSPFGVFGHYTVTAHGGYRVWPVLRWLVLHIAELDLATWILPFAAVIVLVANARHLDRAMRVYAAVVASIALWLLPEVAAFASRYSGRIEERYLVYLPPLMIFALFAWIERGLPRPPRASVVAAGLAAALPGVIPFAHLLNISAQSDTLGLYPWWYVSSAWTGIAGVGVVVVAVSTALAACFLWLPRRHAGILPAVVAAGLLLTWLPIELWTHGFPPFSSRVYAQGIGPGHRSWIDRAVGPNAHVGVIWSGGNRIAVWENEFWNRSVERVYDLGAPLPGQMPEIRTRIVPETGVLPGVTEPYVVADSSVQLVGTVIARDPAKQLTLYRVSPPVRVTTRVAGLYPTAPGVEAWSRGRVSWQRSNCAGGTVAVKISSDSSLFRGTLQTLSVSGTTVPRVYHVAPSTEDRQLKLPLTPARGICRLLLSISPTRVPARYPGLHNADTRSLGLRFTPFVYTP